MRDFLHRHRRQLTLALLVAGSLAAMAMPETATSQARAGLATPFVPAQAGVTYAGNALGGLFRPLVASWRHGRDVRALQDDVARLEREKAQLQQRLAERDRDLTDALSLRRALPAAQLDFLVAPVIARDSSVWSGTITVGRGWQGGVRPGQLVLGATERLVAGGAGDGVGLGDMALDGAFVVGRVTAVGPFHCVVRLITDPDSVMRAQVVGERDGQATLTSTGILRGSVEGKARLTLEFVRTRDDVRPGDAVMTAGYGGVLPAPLVVGRVQAVRASEMPLLSEVVVTPEAAVESLSRVVIVHARPREAPAPTEEKPR